MAQFADLMRVDFICPHGRPWGTRDAAPRVTVPDWIKPLDMQALLEQIECMPEPARTAGLAKWTEQSEKIEKANCRGCAVNAATSRVRVWLAQTLEETK